MSYFLLIIFVMADTQLFKDRLIKFIGYLGISVREFERVCGFSNGTVGNIRNSLRPEKLETLKNMYPQLNLSWLYTGEGEMLRTVDCTNSINVTNSTQVGNNSIGSNSSVELLLKEISNLRKMYEEDRAKLLDMQQQLISIISELSKVK